MNSSLATPAGVEYAESRQHETRKSQMVMVDGNLVANAQTNLGGTSARVFNQGYWGFASVPVLASSAAEKVGRKAVANAAAMERFGQRARLDLAFEASARPFPAFHVTRW